MGLFGVFFDLRIASPMILDRSGMNWQRRLTQGLPSLSSFLFRQELHVLTPDV
jgi:hypothetical protein